MSRHESTETTAGIALEAHADELRRRCEAVARFQGGHTCFIEELGIFRSYAQEKDLYLASPPPELSTPPSEEGSNGWRRFVIDGNIAFFDPERNVVISDTHRGNLILMADGLLAPIDLRVQPLDGALLDIVLKLCRETRQPLLPKELGK